MLKENRYQLLNHPVQVVMKKYDVSHSYVVQYKVYVKKPALFLGLHGSLMTMATLFRKFQLDLRLMKKSGEKCIFRKITHLILDSRTTEKYHVQ